MIAFPSFCLEMYGFETILTPAIQFWMAYAGVIIFLWTALLLWAMRKLQERKFIALVTVFVVLGFMVIQICGFMFQVISLINLIRLLIIQLTLISILGYGYYKA
jgi:predicted permease